MAGGPATLDFTLPQISDSFGYTCQLVALAYIEATSVLRLDNDNAVREVPLPFAFPFYGQSYTTAWVSADGFLNFLGAVFDDSNEPLPAIGGAVFPFWDSLSVDASASVRTEVLGTAPDRRFVIEWRNVGLCTAPFCTITGRVDFEAVLFENGDILFQYRNIAADGREQGNSATIGIVDHTVTVALQYSFNEPLVRDDTAILFQCRTCGLVRGLVTNAGNGTRLAGATLQATGPLTRTGLTGPDGFYNLLLPPGTYAVTASALGYLEQTASGVVVNQGQTTIQDFALEPVAGTNMFTLRRQHTATRLNDGRVLVAGGWDTTINTNVNRAEIYDPTTGTWSVTSNMGLRRHNHTATLLNDGRVLVAGGDLGPGTAEIYDPSTGTWSVPRSMVQLRASHSATLLTDGRVLVANVGSAEVYDPSTDTWSPTGSMVRIRQAPEATLLSNGQVLVAGGGSSLTGRSAELYDPATNSWTATGSMVDARIGHTLTSLNDGRVLVAGGSATASLNSAELYDPAFGTWTSTASMSTARQSHTATRLNDGRVLVAGGAGDASAELYDPAQARWSQTGKMSINRRWHTATLLNDGKVLVAGGDDFSGSVNSAEIFDPATGRWSAPGGGTPPPIASITVIAPNGGEVWAIGSTQTIQWSSQGVTGNVKIQLSRDGGASYKQIANNVPNTGAFQWKVTKPATTQALIRVISMDQPEVQDTSDSVFSITQ